MTDTYGDKSIKVNKEIQNRIDDFYQKETQRTFCNSSYDDEENHYVKHRKTSPALRYYRENLKECREKNRNYHKNNPEKMNEIMRKWRENPRNKLSLNISRLINYSLKNNKNGSHWENLVGYTLEDLMVHIEKQFKDGMSWGNYGKNGWWIDHIRPISIFSFESPEDEEFKKCWSLDNLQPLWAKENQIKGNRILI